jgi:DNA ligase-1
MYEPMLARVWEEVRHKVTYPAYVQPKLDGIRCVTLTTDDLMYSRTGKIIPAAPSIQEALSICFPDMNLDGELFIPKVDFEDISSTVRRTVNIKEDPRLKYWIFDINTGQSFAHRLDALMARWKYIKNNIKPVYLNRFVIVTTMRVFNEVDVKKCFDFFVEAGFEGAMFRSAEAPYECGKRSPHLLKLKPWHDCEAIAVKFIEGVGKHNGRLGAIECSTLPTRGAPKLKIGVTVKVGTGFSDVQREEIWYNQQHHLNKRLTIKYQMVTKKGIPRFPVFKCWR